MTGISLAPGYKKTPHPEAQPQRVCLEGCAAHLETVSHPSRLFRNLRIAKKTPQDEGRIGFEPTAKEEGLPQ